MTGQARLAVIGLGYLGATHAACMAELGHPTIGVDVDPAKLAKLGNGDLPFFEPGLAEILQRNVAAGRLRFSSSYREAVEFADVFFLTAGTPPQQGAWSADLRDLESAITELAALLDKPTVIIGKSTVPVGTAQRLSDLVRRLAPAGDRVELAWSPEFIREGCAVQDSLHPDRIVVGVAPGASGRPERVIRELYAAALDDGVPLLVTDLATAELVKQAANAFLATKVSFINAIAEVCDAAGADVTQVAEALGYDARIGSGYLNAGLGFGGGCLPKDVRALMARAEELGTGRILRLLKEVDSINGQCRTGAVDLAGGICDGSLEKARVAILGASFKPNSDDVRDSPALDVASELHARGATVRVFDPYAMDNARHLFPQLEYASSALDACEGADVVMVLTEWDQFRAMDPAELAAVVRTAVVIDGRNCLDRDRWTAAGWVYRGLGRGGPV